MRKMRVYVIIVDVSHYSKQSAFWITSRPSTLQEEVLMCPNDLEDGAHSIVAENTATWGNMGKFGSCRLSHVIVRQPDKLLTVSA